MSDFYYHRSTHLTGLQKSKDKEIVCHTLHTHMARIFLEGFMRLHFLLHDLIENPSKISEILFCNLKKGLKGQNSCQTFIITEAHI